MSSSKLVGRVRNQVNDLIQEKHIKQSDLAKEIGVHPTLISHFINGRSGISLEVYEKITDYFNEPLDKDEFIDLGLENNSDLEKDKIGLLGAMFLFVRKLF